MKNVGIALLMVLIATSLIALFGRPVESTEEVSLSKIVQEIQAGHVTGLEVKQDEITAELNTTKTKLTTLKEDGVSVTETLSNLGVSEEQLRNLRLSVYWPTNSLLWTC